MTGVAAVASGARKYDVIRTFWRQQSAAGVPFYRRGALAAVKAVAVAGYARGRDEGASAGAPVEADVR